MADAIMTKAELAAGLEESAAKAINGLSEYDDPRNPGYLQFAMLAQAQATLALSLRTADQTDRLERALGDAFGDDSHLDGIKKEIRDGLDAIRVDGVGVG